MALQRVRSNMLANNFVLDDDQGLIVGSGNNIYIDTVNNRVGINTNSPTHDFTVAGNIHATGNITAGGDITIGDSDTDTLTITAEIGSDILPDIDNTYDLGSAAKKWAEVHATTFYGDGSQLTGIAATLDDILTNGNTSALNIDLTGGTVTATSFIGDGSQLTGLASTLDEVTTNGATTTNSITVGGLIVNSSGALGLPVGTTAQRPTAADGLIRFNSDLVAFEGYDGVEWGALGGGGATYSATAPTTNLKEGDLWFDTGTTGELYVYSGTEWLSVTGAGGSAFYQRGFLGDGSTTAFNVYGTGTSTVVVYINGVFVTTPADYSYANGIVTFVTPPALNDEINVLVYGETTGISLSLDSLTDVDLTTTAPTDSQVLVYNAAGNKFIPGDAAADFTDLTGSLALTQIPDGLITPAKLQTGVVFVDEFTADGNTASFTLSQDPGSAAAIQVFVDSVPQLASNYTVVGTTLTLPANPANGSIVEVRGYGAAVAVGTVADLAITTNKIANGAVTAAKLDAAITTDDITEGSTNFYYTDARVQTKLGDVSGHIIPDTDIAYDLGSTNFKFRDLYLSGNSIQLGTREITSDNIPEVDLTIAPEVLEIQVSAPQAGQDTQWLWTWETSSLPYARRQITNSPEISVPLYKQGTYTVNNFAAYDIFDQMTQTHSLYLKWIDGAGTDNTVSWATSTGPVSDTHPDINGGNATDVQRINISVPSTITPPTLTAPNVSYTVTNNGAGAYTFSGAAKGDNPNIGPFYRGGTYTFNISATGHPLYLTTDNGTNFASGTYFGEYTDGVTGSRTDSGTITFTVPSNAPDTLYYQCGNHSPMRGAITVKDLAVETNINGNYIVYFQHTQEGHKTPVELRPIPSLVNQMCLVYDASVNRFVPQDLATYVENTPSFENKIREVAGTAELVVEDGSAVIAKVNVYDDSTYLPLVGNNPGDQAFATDTDILYIWDGSAWQQAGAANTDDLAEGSTNLFYTDARVDARLASGNIGDLVVGGNLTVNGTTTTINSTTLTVDDKNIVLASGAANSSEADGAGITIDGAGAALTYNGTSDLWKFTKQLQIDPGYLTLGDTGGTDNSWINNLEDGNLEIVNQGRNANFGAVRINRFNSPGGDTTYFRDFVVYDGKGNDILNVVGSTGRVGIGVDAPTVELDVIGRGNISQGINTSQNGSGVGSSGLEVNVAQGQTSTLLLGQNNVINWRIRNQASSGRLEFSGATTGDEKMVIAASGRVGIGTTDPLGQLQIDVNASFTEPFRINDTNASGTTYKHRATFLYQGTEVGSVKSNNTGTTYNTTSDRRLKENIELIIDGKDKIMAMKPSMFNFINDESKTKMHGFIAQEMHQVMPEAVSDGTTMSMDYGRITPVIVAALQDALKEIEELKTRINELEAK